jgi:hypothetical protein
MRCIEYVDTQAINKGNSHTMLCNANPLFVCVSVNINKGGINADTRFNANIGDLNGLFFSSNKYRNIIVNIRLDIASMDEITICFGFFGIFKSATSRSSVLSKSIRIYNVITARFAIVILR